MHTGTDSIEEFVTSTIAEFAHCRPGDVVRQTPLVDLGMDSLGITTLATFVEAEYGCTFTPPQLTALYSAASVDEVFLAVGQVVRAHNSGSESCRASLE